MMEKGIEADADGIMNTNEPDPMVTSAQKDVDLEEPIIPKWRLILITIG
jgi:hypothetical protein